MIKKIGEQDQIQKIIILELQYDNNQLVDNYNLTKKNRCKIVHKLKKIDIK